MTRKYTVLVLMPDGSVRNFGIFDSNAKAHAFMTFAITQPFDEKDSPNLKNAKMVGHLPFMLHEIWVRSQ